MRVDGGILRACFYAPLPAETIGDTLLLTRKPRDAAQFIAFPLGSLPVEAREFLQARFG